MTLNGTIYVTASPCYQCFKLIVSAGIKRIVYGEQYGAFDLTGLCKKLDIELIHFL
jgi:dCMP deaminase